MALLAHQLAWLLTVIVVLVALNLVAGKAGVWSVGHLAFFGVGSYSMAWVLQTIGGGMTAVVLGLALGAAASGIAAAVVAKTALRLKQDFFVIFSIALLELTRNALITWKGPDGFTGLAVALPPLGPMGSDWVTVTVLLFPLTAIVVWFSWAAERGPVERAFALVRRSEETALMLGRDPLTFKRQAFWIAAVLTALAGGAYTGFTGTTEPAKLLLSTALLFFAVLVLGGLNSTLGAVLGALLLVVVDRLLEAFVFSGPLGSFYSAQGRLVVFGLLLIVVVHRHPEGLAGRREVRPYG